MTLNTCFQPLLACKVSFEKSADSLEVQEAQRVPKNLDPGKHTPRHVLMILPKIKDKERILKAAREKETVT